MADSTINGFPSSFSSMTLSGSVLMGAVMSGGDLGFVKEVQEKIKDVTAETRTAQNNLRSAQQKMNTIQANISAASTNKKMKEADKTSLNSQLAEAQQQVANAQQVVSNLQSQLTDLINRALPDAQRREETTRAREKAQADQQRSQQQEAAQSSEQNKQASAELARVVGEGTEAAKPQAKGKDAGPALPKSEVVDRTGEFKDVAEGSKNYNDRLLEGTAEQSPAAYASSKKEAPVGAGAKVTDGMEGGADAKSSAQRDARQAPAGSGLPSSDEFSAPSVAKFFVDSKGAEKAPEKQLDKAGTGQNAQATQAGQAPVPGAPAGAAPSKGSTPLSTNSNLGAPVAAPAPGPAPRATGSTGQVGASGGASNSTSTGSRGGKESVGSSFVLPDGGRDAGRTPVSAMSGKGGRGGGDGNIQVDTQRGTVSVGELSAPASKALLKAITDSPTAAAAGTALFEGSKGNLEPMKSFVQASQPDGRPGEQLGQDAVKGFNKLGSELGLNSLGQGTQSQGAPGQSGQAHGPETGPQRAQLSAGPGGAAGSVTVMRTGTMGLEGGGRAEGGRTEGSRAEAGRTEGASSREAATAASGGATRSAGGTAAPATATASASAGAASAASGDGDIDAGSIANGSADTGEVAGSSDGAGAAVAVTTPTPNIAPPMLMATTQAPAGATASNTPATSAEAGRSSRISNAGPASMGDGGGAAQAGRAPAPPGLSGVQLQNQRSMVSAGPGGAAGPVAQAGAAAKLASGTMGLTGTGSGLRRGSVGEAQSARAVVLGKVQSRAQDAIDPFDTGDVDLGGMSDDAFSALSPMEKVIAVMTHAANKADAEAGGLAGQVSANTELQKKLNQELSDVGQQLLALSVTPQGTQAGATDPAAVSPAVAQLQQRYAELTAQLKAAGEDSAVVMEKMGSSAQTVTTFMQASSNVFKLAGEQAVHSHRGLDQ